MGGQRPSLEIRILGPDKAAIPTGQIGTRIWGKNGEVFRGHAVPVGPVALDIENGHATLVLAPGEQMVWLDVRPGPDTGLGPVFAGPFVAGDSPVTIQVRPAVELRGRVIGPDGKGVRGARVLALPVNEALSDRRESPDEHGAAWADPAGRFSIPDLGGGGYYLCVFGPLDTRQEEMVLAWAGEEEVELPLAAAVRARITVLDPEGAPVQGARVCLHPPDAERPLDSWGASVQAETDRNGVARLGGLDPEGSWILVVDSPWDRKLCEREIEGWKPADTTLRLARGE